MQRHLLALVASLGLILGLTAAPVQAAEDPYFESVGQSNKTFYPLVKDGYKDRTNIWFSTTDDINTLSWEISNQNGITVLAKEDSFGAYYSYDFFWNGRNTDGDPVKKGYYTVTFTVEDKDANVHYLTRQVQVDSKTVTKRGSTKTRGSAWDSKTVRGNCRVYRYKYAGEAWMDCWAGQYAKLTYSAKIPKNAYRVTAKLKGEVRCCTPGAVRRNVNVGKGRVRANVTVINWRAFDVWGLYVNYRTDKKI